MFTLLTHNEPETLAVGRVLAAVTRPGDIIAIDGPLGAGKTRLVRGLAMGMGFEGNVVSSPTFVVANEYVMDATDDSAGSDLSPLKLAGSSRLFHVDAYRLGGPDDLDSLGWDRIVDGSAVVAIEWAERIAAALTGGNGAAGAEPVVWHVRMEPVGGPEQNRRRITIEPPRTAPWQAREGAAEFRKLAAVLAEDVKARAATGSLPRGWAKCATTGKPVPPDSPTFPFADDRARLADLGKWMSGTYTVSREILPEDEGGVSQG